jgi:hypothetical protein
MQAQTTTPTDRLARLRENVLDLETEIAAETDRALRRLDYVGADDDPHVLDALDELWRDYLTAVAALEALELRVVVSRPRR